MDNRLRALDQRLIDCAARVRRGDHLRRLRATTVGQIEEVRQALAGLEAALAKEERDVSRLEGGFAGFLAGLMGSGRKQERLTRERAEAEAARERVRGHRERLARLESDLAAIDAELTELTPAYEEYPRLLADKERLLVEGGDARGEELVRLGAELTEVASRLREYDEAQRAGAAAQQALGVVLSLLEGARAASTWDMLGSNTADLVERRRLQGADQAAWHAQRALDVFARELADVGVAASPQLPAVDTRWFVDTFFDNVITDMLKHQRITRTRDDVAATAQWAQQTLAALAARGEKLARRRADLLARRERLLVEA
ncbi:hypothetical protein [Thermoactinospora rubra]|uniref:hypothetical protein n=1 Tax=Thermoactinospora rubra TaxID=1088767 RepID=UPI000A101EEB|nr:hypothetical protein [Thermoactinospora rubra]